MVKRNDNYTVCDGETIPELNDKVRSWLEKGWHLQGGVAVVRYDYRDETDNVQILFCQAVARAAK